MKSDTTTEGNWINKYGTVGYNVINSGSSYPSNVTVTPANEGSYTWTTTATSTSALEDAPGTGTNRIAACWYASTSFTVDVDFTDNQEHDIELYLLDYNGNNVRSEQIQLSNASTGAVLSTEAASDFSNGIYYNWEVSGNILITFTHQTGPNAILNGLFIDPASASQTAIVARGGESLDSSGQPVVTNLASMAGIKAGGSPTLVGGTGSAAGAINNDQTFQLITNVAAGTTTGMFDDLHNGSKFTMGRKTFRIHYPGGHRQRRDLETVRTPGPASTLRSLRQGLQNRAAAAGEPALPSSSLTGSAKPEALGVRAKALAQSVHRRLRQRS